jgi:hypothetical protein
MRPHVYTTLKFVQATMLDLGSFAASLLHIKQSDINNTFFVPALQ